MQGTTSVYKDVKGEIMESKQSQCKGRFRARFAHDYDDRPWQENGSSSAYLKRRSAKAERYASKQSLRDQI